jgi:hypothetical protein
VGANVASDLERIAGQMQSIAGLMRGTSGGLAERASEIERQLAVAEQMMGGSRDGDRILELFAHAIQRCKEAVDKVRHAVRVSEEWAAGAVGGGESSSGEQASVPQPESASVLRLSTKSPHDKEALASPPPNSVIVVDEKFTYETDGLSRVVKATVTLDVHDADHPRNLRAQRNLVGKLEGDHAGHIFARIFRGPGDLINLVPMAGRLVNLSTYRLLENQWARTVKRGKTVDVAVEFEYEGDTNRPTEIAVSHTIDGVTETEILDNDN